MRFFDAHNHLHDERLAPHRAEILAELRRIGIAGAVVNGTREADWGDVAELAGEEDFVLPSYGLHPWQVPERGPRWHDDLRERLIADPRAAIGEVGLDRWIKGYDLDDQIAVLKAQLDLAAELERAVTIHCIQAWGALVEVLQQATLPRGFLIHAYGGSIELLPTFVKLGAYFSYNAYFIHDRKAEQREVFKAVPPDRLLVETDAPDLRPPDSHNNRPLLDTQGEPINHPANIDLTYSALADLRGVSADDLSAQVEGNFLRLFAPSAGPA